MAEEIEKLSDYWQQFHDESAGEYASFVEYCKLGPKRTLRALSAHVGMSQGLVRSLSKKHKWLERSKAYDLACNQLTPQELSPSETLAHQYAVGTAMLDLGIRAIELKRPGDIKVKDAIKLIGLGSELQRKSIGITDGVTINVGGSFEAVNELMGWLEQNEIEGEVSEEDGDS